jgi:hypothetical protein
MGPKYPDATTELELVNNKFNHSCIDNTSLQGGGGGKTSLIVSLFIKVTEPIQ